MTAGRHRVVMKTVSGARIGGTVSEAARIWRKLFS